MPNLERTEKIMEILKEKTYASVDFLVEELRYSPATVRRDLTYLAGQGLVKKYYGGVSINKGARPLAVRERDHVEDKRALCIEAAKLIQDGDTVFIDGSSTTSYMGELLLPHKNLTVVTNSMKLAIFLGEHGYPCIVTGGSVCDTAMLGGPGSCDIIEKMTFDVALLSMGVLSDEGYITRSQSFQEMHRLVLSLTVTSVYLCVRGSLVKHVSRRMYARSIKGASFVIGNSPFPRGLIEKYPDACFISTDK